MQLSGLLALFATVAVAAAAPGKPDQPGHSESAPGHNKAEGCKKVEGKVFDRIVSIWLENIDYATAIADPNLAAFAKQGVLLTNYYGVTHPSEPNYVAAVGGDYFGIDSDNLLNVPSNVSTVADLLEDKSISWGEYQEDLPYTGYTGFSFSGTSANDYVRKHNPLVIYESVNTVPQRLANIKNFTLFEEDLAANALPQWVFITPNMTNDAHDTNVTFAGTWTHKFLTPLLSNPHFNDGKTLILLTFDENHTYPIRNNVYAVLLGNAVPKHLVGTVDDNFYTHYSAISTISANWGLHTLGRYDVGANVFEMVAQQTGDKIRTTDVTNVNQVLFNASYPGILAVSAYAKQPIPNTNLVVNGRTVLPSIKKQWESQVRCTVYQGQLVPPSQLDPPVLPKGC